ncbi:hypothetical protein ACHAXS_004425 [Conticribra weissflogii]
MTPLIFSMASSSSQRQREMILKFSSNDEENPESNSSKRRRRKRKKNTSDENVTTATTTTPVTSPSDQEKTHSSSSQSASAKSLARELLAKEQMMYDQEEDLTAFIPQKLEDDDRISAAASKAGFSVTGGTNEGGIAAEVEDLFDSREFLQRKREKQLEEQGQSNSDGGVPTKKKIKRSDIKAYTRLLEMDPLADEEDSYFEDEEGVDVISALLGDVERGVGSANVGLQNQEKDGSKANAKKKTSFLGIGSGPLQVGHFIGSLGVILMAFVEYPGFPLTNLPDPLRGALQGGELPCAAV